MGMSIHNTNKIAYLQHDLKEAEARADRMDARIKHLEETLSTYYDKITLRRSTIAVVETSDFVRELNLPLHRGWLYLFRLEKQLKGWNL